MMPRAKRLARSPFARTSAVVGTVAAAVAAPLLAPPPAGPLLSGSVLLALAVLGCRDAAAVRRMRRDLAAKHAAANLLGKSVPQARRPTSAPGLARQVARIREAVAGGFPDSAVREMRSLASHAGIPSAARLDMLRSLSDSLRDVPAPPQPKRSAFDVVFISPLGMAGGTTSANAAEIRVCKEQGLKVGLLHHRIYKWGRNAPLSPRIEELVDGETVQLIGLDDVVECDLAVIRLPTALMKPLERRPRITAGSTAVIVNQTPFKFYEPGGPREEAWDIATVERHVTDWMGPHTWYAGGPQVRVALLEHHAAEIAGLDLSASLWNETIEIDQWRLDGRRESDGRIRIGRHSRDHELKWPEDPETLLRCYPDREPFEIHVLGGAETPTRVGGQLPSNWTVHSFNAMCTKEFLAEIDLMAYFISSGGLEAFGRAPLEAMAAGVPVIMDRRFQITFGPAAIYCEPAEVASTAERIMADPDAYAVQQATAWDFVADRFSGRALLERMSLCARSGNIRDRVEYAPASYWDLRYGSGGNSGEGSRGEEAAYKARYVGDLIKERGVVSLIDWGCGDGGVLEKIDMHGASYLGVDVSEVIVERMRERFAGRPDCRFELPYGMGRAERRDLALSLDVLFHFPVDADYDDYLSRLFGSAERFVLIYSTDSAEGITAHHVRRREFTADIAARFHEWKLVRAEPPLSEGLAAFFLYERAA
ncbi:hypothetical protein [Glycomyces tenuis]|uniref:hypothetical protein n=1 Tax=Glycomyces tenuis TaxID=58116 RepID=UPI000423216C|nr:hypothetical protein [Glycomyces tenuis]